MDSGAFLAAIDSDRKQTEAYQRFSELERKERLPLWTTWGHIGDGDGPSGSQYSCLIAGARVPRALAQPGWDVRIEGHRPGFSESYADGKRQVSYEPIGSEGVEPLVHVRLPVEGYRRDFIFPEEFLLLFDLHRGDDGNWYLVDEVGDDYLAIEVQGDTVVAQTGLVRRYHFGKNADAPQYVTPVTFRKDVLEKYYRSTDKYSVQDGYLRRGGFWGIRIDNEDPKFVVVMLGDLGRDLPFTEQKYWKSFNVPRRGKFSEVAFRRGFLGQFADAAAPDLQFRRLYPEVNHAWMSAFGWQLFLELGEDDAHLLDQVRVLPNDQQGLFDEQVLGLTKLLVDSLNEHELVAAAGPGPEDEKGIFKLGRFLQATGVPATDSIIDCLRGLQAIRSSGAAHRKGMQYEKIRAAAAATDRQLWWADLLEQSIKALEQLRIFARGRNGAR